MGGIVSRNVATNSTPEVSGAKRRTDLVAIQIPRHFDIIDDSIICDKFEPIDWIAILRRIFGPIYYVPLVKHKKLNRHSLDDDGFTPALFYFSKPIKSRDIFVKR